MGTKLWVMNLISYEVEKLENKKKQCKIRQI